jgi:hypothetical protein
MAATYSSLSPWANTQVTQGYLGILKIRAVSAERDDILYTIGPQYAYRPDLLAHDLYGSAALWWVFIQRNLDVLQDPIFDFVPGTAIYLPKERSLRAVLGV